MREPGPAHIRLFGDRTAALKLITIGRKHLGRLKNSMKLAGVLTATRSFSTPMGVTFKVASNLTGLADTDIIEIYVPYGYDRQGGKLWDQCLGFVVKCRYISTTDEYYLPFWHVYLQAPVFDEETEEVITTEFYTNLASYDTGGRYTYDLDSVRPGVITSPVQTEDEPFDSDETIFWVYTGTHTSTSYWWAEINDPPELTFNPKLKDYDLSGYINGAWGSFSWMGEWEEGSLWAGTPKAGIGPYIGRYQSYGGNPCWLKIDPINGLDPDYQNACYNYQASEFAHDFHWASAYRCHLKVGGDAYYIQQAKDDTDRLLRIMVENINKALSVPIEFHEQVIGGGTASKTAEYPLQPCEMFRNDALVISISNTYEEDGFPKNMEFNCFHKDYEATYIALPIFKCRFDFPDYQGERGDPFLVNESVSLSYYPFYKFGGMAVFPIHNCQEYVYNNFIVNDYEYEIITNWTNDKPHHKLFNNGDWSGETDGIDVETSVQPGEYFVGAYDESFRVKASSWPKVEAEPFLLQFDIYLYGTLYKNYKQVTVEYNRDRKNPYFKITVGKYVEFDRIDEAPDFIEILPDDSEEG